MISRRLKRSMALVFTFILCFLCLLPTMVFATHTGTADSTGTTGSTLVVTGEDVGKMGEVFKDLAEEYKTGNNKYIDVTSGTMKIMGAQGSVNAEILTWNETEKKLIFNGPAFEDADKKAKRQAMKAFTEEVTEHELSTSCRQNIADKFTEGSSQANSYLIGLTLDSTSADIFTALKWLGPLLQFARIIIGVGAIVIILLLIASTVMDCCYIGLPMWREAQANKEGGGSDKPFGVSMEAISTVKEIESQIEGGKYKNAYLLYFRRRAMTYVILAICILYLIAGELGGLIQALLNLATGFTS